VACLDSVVLDSVVLDSVVLDSVVVVGALGVLVRLADALGDRSIAGAELVDPMLGGASGS
jgi:hypothetical protein